jgi:uncharacterized damage-inducible protein DinB
MTDSLALRFRRWYQYEREVHHAVLASLRSVPPEGREDGRWQAALDLFAHLLAARRLWLHRLTPGYPAPSTLFPRGSTMEEVETERDEVEAVWTDRFEALSDDDLRRPWEYTSLEGPRYRNTIEEIVTQLFGHGWYHRGQIAALVRACGGEPAATDYIFWCRVPVPD